MVMIARKCEMLVILIHVITMEIVPLLETHTTAPAHQDLRVKTAQSILTTAEMTPV